MLDCVIIYILLITEHRGDISPENYSAFYTFLVIFKLITPYFKFTDIFDSICYTCIPLHITSQNMAYRGPKHVVESQNKNSLWLYVQLVGFNN